MVDFMTDLTVLIGLLSHVCVVLSWSWAIQCDVSGHITVGGSLVPQVNAMREIGRVCRIDDVHGHGKTDDGVGVRDQRPPSLGLGRIIIALFWLLGAWIFMMAVVDLFHAQDQPWGPRLVALLAGVDYLVAAIALTHNGRRMRIVGWVAIALSIAVPLVLWVASLGLEELNSARSAWTGFGADFYYLPLVVSFIGTIWMWCSNPRRIVSLAEQVERPNSPWRS